MPKTKLACLACRVSNAADEARRHPSQTSFNACSLLMMRAIEAVEKQRSVTGFAYEHPGHTGINDTEVPCGDCTTCVGAFCADHFKRFNDFIHMVRHHVNYAGLMYAKRHFMSKRFTVD